MVKHPGGIASGCPLPSRCVCLDSKKGFITSVSGHMFKNTQARRWNLSRFTLYPSIQHCPRSYTGSGNFHNSLKDSRVVLCQIQAVWASSHFLTTQWDGFRGSTISHLHPRVCTQLVMTRGDLQGDASITPKGVSPPSNSPWYYSL